MRISLQRNILIALLVIAVPAVGSTVESTTRVWTFNKEVRQMRQNYDQIIHVRQWHTLRVITTGCRVQVFFDEKQPFDLCDQPLSTGRVGLWTKSDAVTYFDDLKLQIIR